MKVLVLAGAAIAVALGVTAVVGSIERWSSNETEAELMFVRGGDPLGEDDYVAASEREDIFVTASDGSGERLLVENASQPVASHDGRSIAFVREGYIWTASRDGSQQRRLVRGSDPVLGTDGTVWFTRYVERRVEGREGNVWGDDWSVSLFHMSAGRISLISGKPAYKGVCIDNPALSPNEQFVAYSSRYDECVNSVYWRVEVVGRSGARTALGVPNVGHSPAWSPDGRRLVYVTVDEYGDATGISVAPVNGSDARRILDRVAYAPTWSPDGEWIAMYFSNDIWLMRPDGSDRHRLEKPGAREHSPAWLPPAP